MHGLAQETFIHRDLKPSNILLDQDFRAKVSDFGLVKLAKDTDKSMMTRVAGTFGYLAPEYASMSISCYYKYFVPMYQSAFFLHKILILLHWLLPILSLFIFLEQSLYFVLTLVAM